jgi:hypothetical protein
LTINSPARAQPVSSREPHADDDVSRGNACAWAAVLVNNAHLQLGAVINVALWECLVGHSAQAGCHSPPELLLLLLLLLLSLLLQG